MDIKPRISPKEIKRATVACRRELKQGQEYIDIGDVQKAYAAFERAQDYAFQAKDMTINRGNFEP